MWIAEVTLARAKKSAQEPYNNHDTSILVGASTKLEHIEIKWLTVLQ